MRLLACLFLSCCLAVPAHARQDPAPVKKAVENWLKIQIKGLPGEVGYEIGGLDPGNQLAPCAHFDVSRPAGARPWGRSNVMVRCLDEAGWRIYLPVHIRVRVEHLVSARPIARGQTVAADDLTTEVGDLSDLPANVITEPEQAVGKIAGISIPPGKPLRADILKAQLVIRQGQTVKIISEGPGFSVANEGRALNAASAGQVVQVRLAGGQIVSGIADADGTVAVRF